MFFILKTIDFFKIIHHKYLILSYLKLNLVSAQQETWKILLSIAHKNMIKDVEKTKNDKKYAEKMSSILRKV